MLGSGQTVARSGFSGLRRGQSPEGCVLGSGPCSQVWLLWAVKRAESRRMCAGLPPLHSPENPDLTRRGRPQHRVVAEEEDEDKTSVTPGCQTRSLERGRGNSLWQSADLTVERDGCLLGCLADISCLLRQGFQVVVSRLSGLSTYIY